MHSLARVTVCAVAAFIIVSTVGVPSASGAEADGFTLSAAHKVQKKDFPPIAGNYPQTTVLGITLDECKSATGAVAVKINFDFPEDVFTQTTLSVTWPAPEANDVDVYLFAADGEANGDSATGDHPEEVRLADQPNGPLYVCVVSYTGPNAGFTLTGTTKYVDTFQRTPEPATPAPETEKPTAAPVTPEPTVAALPTATAEPVDTPGADGPVKDEGLNAVAGAKQAVPPNDRPRTAQIVFGAITGLIAISGVALVALRIRRDVT